MCALSTIDTWTTAPHCGCRSCPDLLSTTSRLRQYGLKPHQEIRRIFGAQRASWCADATAGWSETCNCPLPNTHLLRCFHTQARNGQDSPAWLITTQRGLGGGKVLEGCSHCSCMNCKPCVGENKWESARAHPLHGDARPANQAEGQQPTACGSSWAACCSPLATQHASITTHGSVAKPQSTQGPVGMGSSCDIA